MFHFRYEVRPKRTHSGFADYGGAMASCWIERDTFADAESVARGWIADEDWLIIATEFADLITKETQLPNGTKYFDQAEIDKEVFVFYTWPIGEPD
jgi:hypothetical protein